MTVRHHRTARALGALILSVSLISASALAQQPSAAPARSPGEVSRISSEISNEIFSPFCPGKTLEMCPSPNAAEVRREVQRLAEQGQDKEAIKLTILETYGQEFRIVEPPPEDNIGLLIAIALGLVFALGAVYVLSRRRKRGAAPPAPLSDATLSDEAADAAGELSAEDREYLRQLHEEP